MKKLKHFATELHNLSLAQWLEKLGELGQVMAVGPSAAQHHEGGGIWAAFV